VLLLLLLLHTSRVGGLGGHRTRAGLRVGRPLLLLLQRSHLLLAHHHALLRMAHSHHHLLLLLLQLHPLLHHHLLLAGQLLHPLLLLTRHKTGCRHGSGRAQLWSTRGHGPLHMHHALARPLLLLWLLSHYGRL
jgi:hypothetical protein